MSVDDSGDPPKTFLARSKELATLAARLGGRELGWRLNSALSKSGAAVDRVRMQMEQAAELVQCLGRLKGAAMKMGQMLSVEGADFLPPEVIEILSRLRDDGVSLKPDRVRQVLTEELGGEKLSRLESLELNAFASASIGQVHRARLDGRDIALKVQFPGVAETIDSDLAILERALRGFLAVARKEIDVAPLIEELAELLRQEVDYELEATNLVRYAEGLRHCGGDQDYVLPVPVAGYVTKKVLGMSFEEGVRIPDWLRTRPSQEERDRVGRQILDLYHAEFFDMGLVQTDPNFSNFLLRPKEGRLVLLDFGAVKSYSDDFRRDYRSLLKVMRHGSDRELLDCALAMDLVHPEESAECLECFVRMLRMSIEPFNPSRQPFVFADADYSKEVRVATLAFTSKVRLSPPPRKILFLHRKLGGVFSLLKSVEARLDLTPYWQRLD